MMSPNGDSSNVKNGMITNNIKHDLDENENTPKRTPRGNKSTPKRAHRKSKVEDTSNLSNKSHKGSTQSASTSEKGGSSRSTYRKLGEAATQVLWSEFFLLFLAYEVETCSLIPLSYIIPSYPLFCQPSFFFFFLFTTSTQLSK